ncbi:MAG: CHAP domain-containing protein, partial [Chitinophagaceae bacterium]
FFVLLIWKKVFRKDTEALASILKTFNGSAKQTADRVKKEGYFETGTEPEPGAICIWLNGNGPAGHAGIVKSTSKKTNTMYNVEGNTNGAGSREGDRVNANKPRTIKREFQPNGLNVYLYIYPRKKK